MKKIIFYSVIAACMSFMSIAAIVEEYKPFGYKEEIVKPTEKEDAYDLNKRYEKTVEEYNKDREKKEEQIKKDDPESISKAIGIKNIEIAFAKTKGDLATQEMLKQDLNQLESMQKAQQILSEKDVQVLIEQKTQELAKQFEQPIVGTPEQKKQNILNPESSAQVADFKLSFKDDPLNVLATTYDIFDNYFNVNEIKNVVDTQASIIDKLDTISKNRNVLTSLGQTIQEKPEKNIGQQELSVLATYRIGIDEKIGELDALSVKALNDYIPTDILKRTVDTQPTISDKLDTISKNRETLVSFKDTIKSRFGEVENLLTEVVDTKIEERDALSIKTAQQQKSFFVRVAQGIKDWFDDFLKPTYAKRSITDEIALVKKNEPILQLEPTQKMLKAFNNVLGEFNNPNLATIATKPENIQRVQNLIDAAKAVEDLFTQPVTDAYDTLQKFSDLIVTKGEERYRGTSNTLFDKLYGKYAAELKSAYYRPDQVYEALGIDLNSEKYGGDPEKVKSEDIDTAYAEKRTLQEQSPEWKAARNASTILRDPVAKVNYDAFLKDYRYLQELKIDPGAPKSQSINEQLNTKGALSTLEITKAQYDEVNAYFADTFQGVFEAVGLKKREVEASGMVQNLRNRRMALETMLAKTKQQLPDIPD